MIWLLAKEKGESIGKAINIFSMRDKEVNVGRQRELDLVKGFLMIMIVFIHFFQTLAGMEAATSHVYEIIFAMFMPTGACLYLFTMGFGSAFMRHSEFGDMVKNGIKLLFYQALSNVCYAAAIVISFSIRNLITGEVAGSREIYHENLYAVLTFVNIFFISGMCYLVLALYRKLGVTLRGYIISAVVVGIVSPFTKQLVSDYVFLGYVFGRMIRRILKRKRETSTKRAGFCAA